MVVTDGHVGRDYLVGLHYMLGVSVFIFQPRYMTEEHEMTADLQFVSVMCHMCTLFFPEATRKAAG